MINGGYLYWICKVMLVVTLLSSSETLIAASKDVREMVRLVKEAHQNNLEQIRTWKGKGTVSHQVEEGDGDSFVMKANATFVIDRNKDANRWNVNVHTKKDKVEGQVEVTPPYLQANMLKEGKYYDYFPGAKDKEGETQNALVIWPKERYNKTTRHNAQFNAMDYLNCPDRDLYVPFDNWYENPEDRKMTVNGNILDVEDRFIPNNMPEMGEVVFQYEFDLSKGGSPVYYRHENKSAELETISKWTYENVDGVWLPLTYSYQNLSGGETRPMKKWLNLITFKKNIVNEPIDPCEFTIEKLGVTKDTPITDRVAGISYRYNELESNLLEDALDLMPSIPIDNNVFSVQESTELAVLQGGNKVNEKGNSMHSEDERPQSSEKELGHGHMVAICGGVAAVAIVAFAISRRA